MKNEMDYIKILSLDPVMNDLINEFGEVKITKSDDYFADLVESIIGQLLSVKASNTIIKRVSEAVGGITVNNILQTHSQILRNAGCSYNKINCLKALAEAVDTKKIDLLSFDFMSEEQIISKLTTIKGIGKWTAEMFLLFSLGKQDIFSLGDGGLNNAVCNLYNNGLKLNSSKIIQISNNWKPFRSYASLYLWKSLQNNRNL